MFEIILWGATGQSKVVMPILLAAGHRITAVFDNDLQRTSPFPDLPVCGDWKSFLGWHETNKPFGFVVCIGGVKGADRVNISRSLEQSGLKPIQIIHSRAWLAESAVIGRGCQLLALCGVGESVQLGDYSIVNTNATVDHDCRIGTGVHIMPGATLAGEVEVGDFASIGSNATVLPRLKIGSGAIVGAGAVVTKNVPPKVTVVGNPAKTIFR